jgi:uridine kinase
MSTGKHRTVTKRNGDVVPFDKARIQHVIKKAILAVEKSPKMDPEREAAHYADEVVSELHRTCASAETLHVEQVQDAIVQVLHRDLARGENSYSSKPESLWMAYLLYREGHCLVRNGRLKPEHFSPDTRPKERLEERRTWNQEHDCDTTRGLNRWYKGGHLIDLIRAAEERSSAQLIEVANRVGDMISGPTSSGKTSTSRKALRYLSEAHPSVRFRALEVDMYFRDNKYTEKLQYRVDGKMITDVNFELPETYDIALLNEHLAALMQGRTVMVPHYDFRGGIRTGETTPFRLEPDEVLLLDCMHALSPQLTEAIPVENKFKLYIEPLTVLSDHNGSPVYFTDVRLLRRMIRDVRTRGYPTANTLWHWHLVRKGERFILPYVHSADMVVDTGLPYELPILKAHVRDELTRLLPMFERNEDLFDGHARLQRILRLFRQIRNATPGQEALVPPDSILREFIGGSVFFEK